MTDRPAEPPRPHPADPAPSFGRSDYPNGGPQTGPVWRAMWAALGDGRWHVARELATTASTAAEPPLSVDTGVTLLGQAATLYGLLDRKRIAHGMHVRRRDVPEPVEQLVDVDQVEQPGGER